MTPDHLPVIGPSFASNNTFNTFGFSTHGFTLDPVVGQMLTDLITEGGTELAIKEFAAVKFSNAEP